MAALLSFFKFRWLRTGRVPRVLKPIILAILGVVISLSTWRFQNTPHAVWFIALGAVILMGGAYIILDYFQESRSTKAVEDTVKHAVQSRQRHIHSLLGEFLRHFSDHVDRRFEVGGVSKLRDYVVGFALDRIYELTNPEEPDAPRTRATLLRPVPDSPQRVLCFAGRNHRAEGPQNPNYLYEYANDSCKEKTTAGYAWYQYEQNERSEFFIESTKKHLDENKDPRDRKFLFITAGHDQRIRSILCQVIHQNSPKRFFGVLCLDSDIDGYLTQEKWDDLKPLIYPYVRLIILADQLHEVLFPIILESAPKSGPLTHSTHEKVEPSPKGEPGSSIP